MTGEPLLPFCNLTEDAEPIVWHVMKDDPPPDGTKRIWAWDENDAHAGVLCVYLPYAFLDNLTDWTEYTFLRPDPPPVRSKPAAAGCSVSE